MADACDTLPIDAELYVEVDDTTFVRRESDKLKVCGTLPRNSDIVIEIDE